MEKQDLVFPNDYPTSLAYKVLEEGRTKEEILKYCRKPPKKRLNFSKINSPFPFSSCWENFTSVVAMKFTMGNRTPDRGYYICLPEEGDLSKDYVCETVDEKVYTSLKITPKDYNHDYEILFQQPVYPQTCEKIDKDLTKSKFEGEPKVISRENYKVNTGLEIARKLIGFVTTGGYSMVLGKGSGIGSIGQEYREQIERIGYVLVRSYTGVKYFKAKIDRFY